MERNWIWLEIIEDQDKISLNTYSNLIMFLQDVSVGDYFFRRQIKSFLELYLSYIIKHVINYLKVIIS